MNKILFSFFCGIVAGEVSILPMVIQQLDRYITVAVFSEWIIIVFVINYIQLSLYGWFKGLVVAVAMEMPILIVAMKTGGDETVLLLVMAGIIGSLVGLGAEKYASLQRQETQAAD